MDEIKYYLPVKVEELYNVFRCTIVDRYEKELVVSKDTLISANDLKAEGAERYRTAINRISMLPTKEIFEITGRNNLYDALENLSAQELIDKVERYYNTIPKVGEVWQANDVGYKLAIRKVENNDVYYYYCDNGISGSSHMDYFKKHFVNTGKTCESLKTFLKELGELE